MRKPKRHTKRQAMVYEAQHDDPMTQRLLKDRRVSVILKDFHGEGELRRAWRGADFIRSPEPRASAAQAGAYRVDWFKELKKFPCFIVYYSPSDYPGKYVVRLFDGPQPTRLITVQDTLEEARTAIPSMFMRLPPSNSDDPVIVETWI